MAGDEPVWFLFMWDLLTEHFHSLVANAISEFLDRAWNILRELQCFIIIIIIIIIIIDLFKGGFLIEIAKITAT